ncbi:MAG: NosD domain-containing protein [Methanobacteriota archaeon]
MDIVSHFGGKLLPYEKRLGMAYFVDGVSGSDGKSGTSWATAKETIGAALALCSPNANDYVFVRKGDYEEAVLVDVDGVHIIGMGAAFCKMTNTSGDMVFDVKSDAVEISGFTIDLTKACYGIHSNVTINHCRFHDNVILGEKVFGIVLGQGSSYNLVDNNRMITSGHNIYLSGDETAQGNVIRDNLLLKGKYGVYLCGASNVYNQYHVIKNNVISNHSSVGAVGINLTSAGVRYNTVASNALCGNFKHIKDSGTGNHLAGNIESA